jgi:hypothetical protein
VVPLEVSAEAEYIRSEMVADSANDGLSDPYVNVEGVDASY